MVDEDINKPLDEWAKILRETRGEATPSTVHHYTSAAGLLGILGSKRIWATHFQFLNDPSEAQLLFKLAATEREQLARPVLSGIASSDEAAIREALLKFTLDDNSQARTVYAPMVVSFSESANSLALWRTYGDDGQGYALGLDAAALDEWSGTDAMTFGPVIYDLQVQKDVIARVLNLAVHYTVAMIRSAGVQDGPAKPRAFDRCSGALLKMWALTAPFFKTPSYAEEREWRLVVDAMQPGMLVRSLNRTGRDYLEALDGNHDGLKEQARGHLHRYQVRERGGKLIPYHELDLANLSQGLLRSVTAGPVVDLHQIADAGVLELLVARGNWRGSIDFNASKIPYRR